MRREPVRHAPATSRRVVDSPERRQHPRDAFGIPSGLRGVLRAEPVRLQLVVAAVLQEQHAKRGFRQPLKRPRRGHEDAEQREADAGARRLEYAAAECRAVT